MQNQNVLSMIYSQKNVIKIISILAFFLLIIAVLVIIFTPAVSGYELSIYDGYPYYFWLCLIIADFLAIVIFLKEMFTAQNKNRWILGFLIFWMSNIILLLLPFFRGYCFYGGASCDIYSHYGWIKDIATSGFLGPSDFYPIIHIFTKTISDFLEVPLSDVLRLIAAFFSALYPIFMLLLAKSLLNNKGQIMFITIFSLPLAFSFYHLTVHPAYFSFVFLPLLLYLYHKRIFLEKKFEITILIIIFCFFIVFFHPITTLFSIIIFLTFFLSSFVFNNSKFLSRENTTNKKLGINSNLLLLLILSFFTWYASFGWGINSIVSIFNNLLFGSDFTIANNYLSMLSISNITFVQTIGLLVMKYGSILVYIFLAFISISSLGIRYIFSKKMKELDFFYGVQLIIIFIISGLMIVSNFIEGNPLRVFRFFVMIATILSGLVIYQFLIKKNILRGKNVFVQFKQYNVFGSLFQRNKSRLMAIFAFVIVSILFFLTVLCICNLYSSPMTYEVNRQFTYMEFSGSEWIVEKRNLTLQISADVGFNLWRMEHYINGLELGNSRIKKEMINTPTHFGYNVNESVSKTFNNIATYLIITENGRQAVHTFPENVQSLVHQWTDVDFITLNADDTVNKIYSNTEFDIWQIPETR